MDNVPPIIQSDLGGYKVCGRRGGASFLQTVRPNKDLQTDSYKCPESYVPCDSLSEDPNAIICVESETIEDCPITDITFDLSSQRV